MKKLRILTLVAAVGAGMLPWSGAGALTGEKITYTAREGEVVKKSYGPIPGNDPLGINHFPGTCAKSPDCTEIPLDIVIPPGKDVFTEEFTVLVSVSWKLGNKPDEDAINDLDIYIFDLTKKDARGRFVQAASSPTGSMPEVAKMFTPTSEKYVLLVSNFAGPNQGFDVEVTFKDASFVPPKEEDFQKKPSGGSTVAPPPEDTSSGGNDGGDTAAIAPPPEAPAAEPALPTGPAPLGDVSATTDADFGTGFDDSAALGVNRSGATGSLFRQAAVTGPPAEVGGVVLALWLGLLPVALLAGALLLLIRRRPAALAMAFPGSPAAS